MNKIRETIKTIVLAAYYSFSFCWRNSKWGTVARFLVVSISTALGYLSVQATGHMINVVQKFKGTNTADTLPLVYALVFLVVILLLGVVAGRFSWFYRSRWSQELRFANQREINDHRATLDVGRVRSKQYDDLQKRINELPYSWGTRISFAEEMFMLFSTIVSFVLFGASLLWYKPEYALVLVLTALPMMIFEFRDVSMWWGLMEQLVPDHKKRHVLERPYHNPNAFVQGLMFNQMPHLRKRIEDNVGGVIGSYEKARRVSLRREMITHTVAVGGLLGVVVHMIWSTAMSAGEVGTLTIVLAASRTFQSNLEAIVSLVADQWNSAKGIILIEKDFFGLKSLITTEHPLVPNFQKIPVVRFDRVSFAYPDTENLVLKNVSFTIEPGSRVAIVGKSGNGKSTIQALLMRHYDPTSGAVYADEFNLRNIEPKEWSNTASSLTQEYSVIERKVGEEIASSRLGDLLDLDAVKASCKFANFAEVVESDPHGYESQIGVEYGGRDFSGGEKQRLALARVHYRNTPILILDEPDAKLDPESAEKVIDEIFNLDGVTVVMITHHVSRAERCDKIIVMGKGEVVEEGTHSELISLGGAYASMFEKDRKRLGGDQVPDTETES